MLLRLRHPPVVGRDHQQREVDGTDAGHHVLHEVFVSRNVDDADVERRDGDAGDGRSRCAKPRSIVMPRAFSSGRRSGSVPVRALIKRALPVIDVAGGGDDVVRRV